MALRTLWVGGLGFGLALALGAGAGDAPAQQHQEIGEVEWLEGCWEQTLPGGGVEERWMPPRAGSMIGVSRTTRDGSLRGFELVVLTERQGALAYEADPSGQSPATFLSTEVSDSVVVFENPEHDFPRRIAYRVVGADSLIAWIDGGEGAGGRRVEFRYGRVGCAGD